MFDFGAFDILNLTEIWISFAI